MLARHGVEVRDRSGRRSARRACRRTGVGSGSALQHAHEIPVALVLGEIAEAFVGIEEQILVPTEDVVRRLTPRAR